jgi:hypothetical protein
MLSKSDFNRLEHVASIQMRRVAPIAIAFAGLVFIGGGVIHFWGSAKFAGFAHMSLSDLLSLWNSNPKLNQLYSGAVVRALENLSFGFWQILLGLLFLSNAFALRSRARFYQRLRDELRAKAA